MFRIRRFAVIRTSTTLAVIYAIIALIFAIPFALILSVGQVTVTDATGSTTTMSVSPLLALIIPLLYAVLGWIFTAIACLVYNLAARFTGGIGVEVRSDAPAVVAVPPPAAAPPLQG